MREIAIESHTETPRKHGENHRSENHRGETQRRHNGMDAK
jgi:hypothetical protein